MTARQKQELLRLWLAFVRAFNAYMQERGLPTVDYDPNQKNGTRIICRASFSVQKRDKSGKFAKEGGIAQGKRQHGKYSLKQFLGEAFTGYKGKDAIDKLLKEKRGHVPDAFYRKDMGGIALVWGNEGLGLAHIIKRRTEQGIDLEQFFKALPDVIEKGKMASEGKGRVRLTHGKHEAIIGPEFNGKKITFILTAYRLYK